MVTTAPFDGSGQCTRLLLTCSRRPYQDSNRNPSAIQSYDRSFYLRSNQHGCSICALHAINTRHSEFDDPRELAVSQYNHLRRN